MFVKHCKQLTFKFLSILFLAFVVSSINVNMANANQSAVVEKFCVDDFCVQGLYKPPIHPEVKKDVIFGGRAFNLTHSFGPRLSSLGGYGFTTSYPIQAIEMSFSQTGFKKKACNAYVSDAVGELEKTFDALTRDNRKPIRVGNHSSMSQNYKTKNLYSTSYHTKFSLIGVEVKQVYLTANKLCKIDILVSRKWRISDKPKEYLQQDQVKFRRKPTIGQLHHIFESQKNLPKQPSRAKFICRFGLKTGNYKKCLTDRNNQASRKLTDLTKNYMQTYVLSIQPKQLFPQYTDTTNRGRYSGRSAYLNEDSIWVEMEIDFDPNMVRKTPSKRGPFLPVTKESFSKIPTTRMLYRHQNYLPLQDMVLSLDCQIQTDYSVICFRPKILRSIKPISETARKALTDFVNNIGANLSIAPKSNLMADQWIKPKFIFYDGEYQIR